MTDDITDQDIETAREFIDHVRKYRAVTGPNAVTAVRVLEALIPAPATTLAEEIRDTPRWWTHGAPTWQECCARFETLADRAEQIEEALAVEGRRVKKIAAERDRAKKERDYLADEIDKANTDILHLTTERDKALNEINSLRHAPGRT